VPRISLFSRCGARPSSQHSMECYIRGRVRYVERGPTFANSRQTWATPKIENGALLERYTSDELWATRPSFYFLGSELFSPWQDAFWSL